MTIDFSPMEEKMNTNDNAPVAQRTAASEPETAPAPVNVWLVDDDDTYRTLLAELLVNDVPLHDNLGENHRDNLGEFLPSARICVGLASISADVRGQNAAQWHLGGRAEAASGSGGVKNRQTGWPRWNMGLSAEDIPEVRVQGVEPDLF
jgi:hypothetical protein